MLDVFLENLRVDNAVSCEHGPQQLPRARPQFAIRDEDTVSEELAPFLMERLAFAIVGELARQQGLDVLRVRGQQDAVGDPGVDFGCLGGEGRS